MAKGWESKSIESQVQDSESKDRRTRTGVLTPLQIDTRRRREVLILSRARVEIDLQASRDPRYRDMLTRALADIEAQLSALENIV